MISRVLPFPRGRMKMTTYSDDEYVADYSTQPRGSLSANGAGLGALFARDKALSDFTRVVEETGVLDQGRSQKEGSHNE